MAMGVLTACSSPEDAPADAPQTQSAEVASQSGQVGALTASGANLAGEVSDLSGEITAFRVEQTATQTIIEIASDVLFAFDKADLSPEAPAQLHRAAELIRQGGSGPIEVRGYTDTHGEDTYNLALSERRAVAVADWLANEARIDTARLRPRGYGEADPVAPNEGSEGNDYPEGRALNRRVTIVIPK